MKFLNNLYKKKNCICFHDHKHPMESVVNNLQPRQDFDNSEMADMQNLVKVALRKQIKSVLKLMSLENRVEQSNKITQKVSQHLNMKKKGN